MHTQCTQLASNLEEAVALHHEEIAERDAAVAQSRAAAALAEVRNLGGSRVAVWVDLKVVGPG